MPSYKKSDTKALVPTATIEAFSRSIYKEASKYGFSQIDVIKLINCLMDLCSDSGSYDQGSQGAAATVSVPQDCAKLPIKGSKLQIRAFDEDSDSEVLASWLPDRYGRYFVLSCATAQQVTVESLVNAPGNHLGIVTALDGRPIGAMAYLDHSEQQRRAELRKLIGNPDYRGKGLAEEATRLWVQYGIRGLDLQKIYVSTLQTQIANIRLNEDIGFKVEGLLRNEVLIDGERHDVLRMGLFIASGDDSHAN